MKAHTPERDSPKCKEGPSESSPTAPSFAECGGGSSPRRCADPPAAGGCLSLSARLRHSGKVEGSDPGNPVLVNLVTDEKAVASHYHKCDKR